MAGDNTLTLEWGDGSGTDEVEENAGNEPVSLALVVDVSRSITDADYRIQREGTGLALRNISDDIVAMAEEGTPVIVSYVEFSSDSEVMIQSRVLTSAEDVEQLAFEIENMERSGMGGTRISEGMSAARAVHEQVAAEYGPLSRTITDISADGFTKESALGDEARLEELMAVQAEHALAMANGTEVNGIVMPDFEEKERATEANAESLMLLMDVFSGEDGKLDPQERERMFEMLERMRIDPETAVSDLLDETEAYFRDNVITGFTVRANNAEEYGETLEMKLRRELLIGQNDAITNTPVAPSQSNDADLTARPI